MNYHVDWTDTARDQMREIWRQASPQLSEQLLVALLQIAEALTLRPKDVGESRTGTLRIVFFSPLAFIYNVDVDRHMVRITQVKLFGPK